MKNKEENGQNVVEMKEPGKESKLKILVAGDLHGDVSASKRLAEKAEREKVDLILSPFSFSMFHTTNQIMA